MGVLFCIIKILDDTASIGTLSKIYIKNYGWLDKLRYVEN